MPKEIGPTHDGIAVDPRQHRVLRRRDEESTTTIEDSVQPGITAHRKVDQHEVREVEDHGRQVIERRRIRLELVETTIYDRGADNRDGHRLLEQRMAVPAPLSPRIRLMLAGSVPARDQRRTFDGEYELTLRHRGASAMRWEAEFEPLCHLYRACVVITKVESAKRLEFRASFEGAVQGPTWVGQFAGVSEGLLEMSWAPREVLEMSLAPGEVAARHANCDWPIFIGVMIEDPLALADWLAHWLKIVDQ